MDKFVVRQAQKSQTPSPNKRRHAPMRQATIESLTGVVVIEELERANVVLQRSDVSVELKVDTLQSLKRKNPAKDILVKTGIGKTVHRLCKDENEQIATEAKNVYSKWRASILSKVNRPLMEVECDQKTKNFRRTARQMILGVLRKKPEGSVAEKKVKSNSDKGGSSKCDDDTMLAEDIERELFKSTSRKCTNPYRRTIRKMVFALKHQDELRASVLDSSISVPEFVKEYLQE